MMAAASNVAHMIDKIYQPSPGAVGYIVDGEFFPFQPRWVCNNTLFVAGHVVSNKYHPVSKTEFYKWLATM